METPNSLLSAVRYFSDLSICNRYMRRSSGPAVSRLPEVRGVNIGEITTRSMLKCRACKKQFSYKVGTIFEDSPARSGQVVRRGLVHRQREERHQQPRTCPRSGRDAKDRVVHAPPRPRGDATGTFRKLCGTIESPMKRSSAARPATCTQSKREKKIRGRGSVGKRIVHGLLERGGEVRAKVVPTTEASELHPIVLSNVERANLYTDEALPPTSVWTQHFTHEAINHAEEYVRGLVHTNGIENFWALFKRMLKGTYVSVAPFHLQRYVDEEAFRFNARKTDDMGRFSAVMAHVPGRRITYRQLCQIDGCGFMGLQ
jgi:hypothetical protein